MSVSFVKCTRPTSTAARTLIHRKYWFKGEIGFFDFYIIPLAKKLKQCEVFGHVSDELLEYAKKNREEWLARGEEPVREMITRIKSSGVMAH